MKKILIITESNIGRQMTALGIRNFELAKTLSKDFCVTLAINNSLENIDSDISFNIVQYSNKTIKKLFIEHNIILAQEFKIKHLPFLYRNKKILILDLYAPLPIESFELFSEMNIKQHNKLHRLINKRYLLQLNYADFILCSNERQKNFWTGILNHIGKITNKIYDENKNLDNLIACVPFGYRKEQTQQNKQKPLKEKIILWNSGIWNWLDGQTLVKSFIKICKKYDNIKLVFLGTHHQDSFIKMTKELNKTILLAKKSNLYNKKIVFLEKRIPYSERQKYIKNAFIGINLHYDTIESRFCFRSRILDFIGLGIPIINTKGDIVSNLICKHKIGITVNPENELDIFNAIEKLLTNPVFYNNCKQNLKNIQNDFSWEQASIPLKNFILNCNLEKRFNFYTFIKLVIKTILFYGKTFG